MVSSSQLSPDQALTILSATPGRLAEITAGAAAADLRAAPAPGQWSAVEVLAHLRACADVWGGYVDLMTTTDRPTFKAVNPTTWIEQTDYRDLDFRSSWQAFAEQRLRLLAVLDPLPAEGWWRIALVTGAGPATERTVLSYLDRMARHERTHVRQVERLFAAPTDQPARLIGANRPPHRRTRSAGASSMSMPRRPPDT